MAHVRTHNCRAQDHNPLKPQTQTRTQNTFHPSADSLDNIVAPEFAIPTTTGTSRIAQKYNTNCSMSEKTLGIRGTLSYPIRPWDFL